MLYREYDPVTLKKLQNLELDILKDFDALCGKWNIGYFCCGGTAIGEARQGSFIPWDDDIDVGMLRSDYEKFLKIARRKEYQEKYYVLNPGTSKTFPYMTTRWCLRGTRFREDAVKHLDGDFGIFLDIFCFDNVPDRELFMKMHAWRAWFWGKLLILYHISSPVLYFTGRKAAVVLSICAVANRLLRILPLSHDFLFKQSDRVSREFQGKATRRVAYLHDPHPYTSMINRDDLIPYSRRPYSGISASFPRRIEAYLRQRFGEDYLEPPPEDKRHNHPPFELDFGKYT